MLLTPIQTGKPKKAPMPAEVRMAAMVQSLLALHYTGVQVTVGDHWFTRLGLRTVRVG